MNCVYCNREITNKGSLVAHEQSCHSNPNRVKHIHSPLAGRKAGSASWNKGIVNNEAKLQRSVEFFDELKVIL